jgi:hypothetical protein
VLAFAVDPIHPSALRFVERDAVVGPMVQVINLVEAAIATPALTQSDQSRDVLLTQHFWACANTPTLMPKTALHELCSTVIARELQLFVR